ncbi:MAG: GAF domain-containing protein [bacterium]|nr:GAF domain-containing protein [bacterium]
MYKDDQKAILMMKNPEIQEELEMYLYHRYNLDIEIVDDVLEVFNILGNDEGNDESFELVILDETVSGLYTTSHTLRTLKSRYTHLNVLFLSTLLEITPPYRQSEMELLPGYKVDSYRAELIDMKLDKQLALHSPITLVTTLAEAYQTVCRTLMQIYDVDWAMCSVLRLDEKPVKRGVVAAEYPLVFTEPREFMLKGTGYLEEMFTHFKPVHIPDLNEDDAFCKEIEKKFSRRYRSALLLPMQYNGNCIGLIGLFTLNYSRLYHLADIDLLQRFADMATVCIIAHFYQEHGDLDINKTREEIAQKEDEWDEFD